LIERVRYKEVFR